MSIKKHLEGGTLHAVMATEIKRAIAKFAGEDQAIEKAALELGVLWPTYGTGPSPQNTISYSGPGQPAQAIGFPPHPGRNRSWIRFSF